MFSKQNIFICPLIIIRSLNLTLYIRTHSTNLWLLLVIWRRNNGLIFFSTKIIQADDDKLDQVRNTDSFYVFEPVRMCDTSTLETDNYLHKSIASLLEPKHKDVSQRYKDKRRASLPVTSTPMTSVRGREGRRISLPGASTQRYTCSECSEERTAKEMGFHQGRVTCLQCIGVSVALWKSRDWLPMEKHLCCKNILCPVLKRLDSILAPGFMNSVYLLNRLLKSKNACLRSSQYYRYLSLT